MTDNTHSEERAMREVRRYQRMKEAQLESRFGEHQRWNWRTRERVGPGHDRMSEAEIRKALRQMSWRRAL